MHSHVRHTLLGLADAVSMALFGSAVSCLILLFALGPAWPMVQVQVSTALADRDVPSALRVTAAYDEISREEAAREEAAKAPVETPDHIERATVSLPASGERYGHLSCERVGLDAPVYWDDTDEILWSGPGQSTISMPPGFGTAIIIAGHNTTDFACLYDVEEGDIIDFGTPWCDYAYAVDAIEVHKEDELDELLAKMAAERNERLVLYTCWPSYVVSWRKTDRLCVFAHRIEGMDVR